MRTFAIIAAIGLLSLDSAPTQARHGRCSGNQASVYYAPVGDYQHAQPPYAPSVREAPRLRYAPQLRYAPSPAYEQSQARRQIAAAEKPAAPPATTISIAAYDNYFHPRTVHVQPGTTVRWLNNGRHTHTITASDESWDSGSLTPGATYSATFHQPGTYRYFCRHHAADAMEGVIVVGHAGTQPATSGGGSRPPAY
jgi:plastocyanin